MRFKALREGYVDLRFGWTVIGPAIGFANFLMLAYITFVKDIMPLEVFAPLFSVAVVVGLTYLGKLFRTKQLKIDSVKNYEQQIEPNKTTRIMFDDLHEIQKHL